jgi:hypothetical protein
VFVCVCVCVGGGGGGGGARWLMCHPVQRPTNNLANWISMDALDTEVCVF